MTRTISIHAPRKGERRAALACFTLSVLFQSTLPARGSDLCMLVRDRIQREFQSTLPARGSDLALQLTKRARVYFNPRSPQGGATRFSVSLSTPGNFNPRSLQGGATAWGSHCRLRRLISIHAPRKGERRECRVLPFPSAADFNPRSPQGGATLRCL